MISIVALCAAYALYCLATNPAGPITTPDSFHYLNGTPIVPRGYPWFLTLTGPRGAIVVQPLLYATALAWLGREIARTTRSVWPAIAALAGCMVVPQIRDFHASILSESLFLTLLISLMALAVRFGDRPSWQLLLAMSITIALGATVRRTAVAFLPVLIVLVMMQRRRAVRMLPILAAAVAPFMLILAGEQLAARRVHAGASSSLFGRHMFAKAALIDAPAAPSTDDPVRRAIDRQLDQNLDPIRRLLAAAPRRVRDVLTINYETCLQGGCADEARALTGESIEARQTEVLGAAGLARIGRAPRAFLGLTWRHYRALWAYNRLRHPATAAALNAYLATAPPLPFEEWAIGPGRTLAPQPSPHVRYAQYALHAVALATGALAIVAVLAGVIGRSLPSSLAAASIAALTAHAGLLLTAMLAAGFTRFLLGLWPAIVVAVVLGGYWALRFGRPLRNTNF